MVSKRKRITTYLLVFALVFGAFFSVSDFPARAAGVTAVKFNQAEFASQKPSSGDITFKWLPFTVTPADVNYTISSCTSSNPSVAKIDKYLGGTDSKVRVQILSAGTTTISITVNGLTATCKLTVAGVPVQSISFNSYPTMVYAGKSASTKVSVSVKPSDAENKKVTYSSSPAGILSVAADGTVTGLKAGTARVTVSATDGSGVSVTSGDIRVLDTGNPAPQKKKVSDLTIKLNKITWVYTGKAITPQVTVTDGSTVLAPGANTYKITFANNINAGTTVYPLAVVKIVGQGNYEGTVKKTFKIIPRNIAGTSVKVPAIAKQKYTGKAIKPAVTVKYGTKTFKAGAKTFKVSYKNNVKVGTATVTITGQGNFSGTRKVTFKIAR